MKIASMYETGRRGNRHPVLGILLLLLLLVMFVLLVAMTAGTANHAGGGLRLNAAVPTAQPAVPSNTGGFVLITRAPGQSAPVAEDPTLTREIPDGYIGMLIVYSGAAEIEALDQPDGNVVTSIPSGTAVLANVEDNGYARCFYSGRNVYIPLNCLRRKIAN